MPVTSASTKSAFLCLRSRSRSGTAIFPSDRIPVEHWYSRGWNRWCGRLSMRVTRTGARRSILAANSPANPPPMITTRRWLPCSFMARSDHVVLDGWIRSAGRIVPAVPAGQQPAGFGRAPAAPGVGVYGRDVAEHRVDDPPGGLDGVLTGKQPAVPVQGRADEPVVRAHVRAGLPGERQILQQRLHSGAWLLTRQGEADRRLRPDPEAQRVTHGERIDAEHVMRRPLEADADLGGGDRHALAGPDQDRHALPAPGVGGEPDRDEGLRGRFRVDPLDLVVALVLAAYRIFGGQRPQRGHHP